MAVLTLKNVPEELVDRLKREARQNRRSLNQEALLRLEASIARRRPSPEDTVAFLRRFQKRLGHLPPLTDAFIERARREGRP